ncbi:disease resistance protein [Striga asiatica]|uniref:Disease resistance protein n=1 Tax=Striga asiatica TaxID=4170 RepID=A0A5A7QA01_STRAF|nr:disease resistance protein [Striga asiatica]
MSPAKAFVGVGSVAAADRAAGNSVAPELSSGLAEARVSSALGACLPGILEVGNRVTIFTAREDGRACEPFNFTNFDALLTWSMVSLTTLDCPMTTEPRPFKSIFSSMQSQQLSPPLADEDWIVQLDRPIVLKDLQQSLPKSHHIGIKYFPSAHQKTSEENVNVGKR